LVTTFDQGQLAIPHGTKLSNFLGDILLCKASRLTKKMKNAKLSARSFELACPKADHTIDKEEYAVLSVLQERFINTMPSESSQLELRFNVAKQWRAYFSNVCVQVGYPHLDGSDWIASLEELERRASSAEEQRRNVRRRRMGFSLRNNVQPPVQSDFVKTNVQLQTKAVSDQGASKLNFPTTQSHIPASATPKPSDERYEATLGKQEIEVEHHGPPRNISEKSLSNRARALSEDFDDALMVLMDPIEDPDKESSGAIVSFPRSISNIIRSRDPFLEAIGLLLEERNLPFQHADVWVPSFIQSIGAGEEVQLLHAGHVTRSDQTGALWSALENFGEYSKDFSFQPGAGLPGRVYSAGKALWEFGIDKLDPSYFLRAGGANEYGVKTATGIPFSTPGIGRMVVVLYSCNDLVEEPSLTEQCTVELAKYSPEPKWKLVIEIGENNIADRHKDTPATMDSLLEANQLESRPFNPFSGPATSSVTVANLPHPHLALSASSSSRLPKTISAPEDDVLRIVSLLGDQLSMNDDLPTAGESTSSFEKPDLIAQFMSIRLLLLRPASRRSHQDNEVVDLLRSSFQSYSHDNTRNGRALAVLLAREWLWLKSTLTSDASSPSSVPQTAPTPSSAESSSEVHQCHEMKPVLSPAYSASIKSFALPLATFPVAPPASMIFKSALVLHHTDAPNYSLCRTVSLTGITRRVSPAKSNVPKTMPFIGI
jgi:hypothetical protein